MKYHGRGNEATTFTPAKRVTPRETRRGGQAFLFLGQRSFYLGSCRTARPASWSHSYPSSAFSQCPDISRWHWTVDHHTLIRISAPVRAGLMLDTTIKCRVDGVLHCPAHMQKRVCAGLRVKMRGKLDSVIVTRNVSAQAPVVYPPCYHSLVGDLMAQCDHESRVANQP